MDLPYYHGPLTKGACETLLFRHGKDGKFLLRDSESVPGALCLCVLFQNKVYTYRIRRTEYGYYTMEMAEETRKMLFPNLQDLISKFKKPDQGLVIELLHPVVKTNLYHSYPPDSLDDHDDDDDYENVYNDYVDVLP